MKLDITNGKITRIETLEYSFCDDAYELGMTEQGNYFAAISKGTAVSPKGQLVLIPVHAVTAIFMEVNDAKQQDTGQDKD